MKKTLLFLFLIAASFEIKAGCCSRAFVTRVATSLQPATELFTQPGGNHLFFSPGDFFTLSANGCSCGAKVTKLLYKGNPISFSGPIACNSGSYIVSVLNDHYEPMEFVFTITNGTEVGIEEEQAFDVEFALFPNPAKEDVTVSSGKEELKSISVFDLSSQLIKSYEVSGNSTTLPLEGIPPGIYFVKVATLNERSSIRKLVIQ